MSSDAQRANNDSNLAAQADKIHKKSFWMSGGDASHQLFKQYSDAPTANR